MFSRETFQCLAPWNGQTHFKNLTVLPAFVSAHLGTLYIKLLTIDVNKTEV